MHIILYILTLSANTYIEQSTETNELDVVIIVIQTWEFRKVFLRNKQNVLLGQNVCVTMSHIYSILQRFFVNDSHTHMSIYMT